jgi:hypothetical protein
VIGWTWDAAAGGTELCGIIPCRDRETVRRTVAQAMRERGARTAVAREVRYGPDCQGWEPTGAAMTAVLACIGAQAGTVTWRDVRGPAGGVR